MAREHPGSYREGYLYGLFRADAAAEVVRDGRIDLSFPSARIELEALGRAHHFLAAAPASPRLVAVGAGSIGARAGIPVIPRRCGARRKRTRGTAASRVKSSSCKS